METFFNKVKASVRVPNKAGVYYIETADGEKYCMEFNGNKFLTEGIPMQYWLEELPVLTEVEFNKPTCKDLKGFKLDVDTDDKYASASRVALRSYAYTIKSHDSRLAKTLYACVDQYLD